MTFAIFAVHQLPFSGSTAKRNDVTLQPGDLAQRNEGYRAAYPSSVKGYEPLHLDAILASCTGSSYLLGKARRINT